MAETATSKTAAPVGDALLDVFHQIALEPVSGSGVWITARDGQRYLDFYGGHAVALLGYAHPRLLATLDAQARRLFFQSNIFDLEIRHRAAAALARFAPAGLGHAFFVNSGAEANENALRVAFLATKRPRVVALTGAFHGRTAAAAAITEGNAKWYGFPQTPFAVTWVPFDDVAALEAAVDDTVAAVIFEPVQGMAGARALSPAFVQAARAATRRHGACLIFDEVQCGMGRTGFAFAAQSYGVTPDLLTTAKGLAGGFPVGALLVSDALAPAIKKGDLGTTFGGGPLACALVETVIETIESEQILPNVRHVAARIAGECRVGPVVDVQGRGLLCGLRTSRPAKQVQDELRQRNILVGTSADPNVVRLLPPLVIDDSHVDTLVAALQSLPW